MVFVCFIVDTLSNLQTRSVRLGPLPACKPKLQQAGGYYIFFSLVGYSLAPWSVILHHNWRPLFNAYEAILAKQCGTKDLFQIIAHYLKSGKNSIWLLTDTYISDFVTLLQWLL